MIFYLSNNHICHIFLYSSLDMIYPPSNMIHSTLNVVIQTIYDISENAAFFDVRKPFVIEDYP